ncbi:MAG: hypothetical protein ACTS3F_12490 [Phycisphaerales bacterium]
MNHHTASPRRASLAPAIAITTAAASALALALAGPAHADGVDIWLSQNNGQLTVGAVDKDDNEFFPGVRVFEGFFGESTDGNFPNETDEPGWYTETLPFGSAYGFDILDALRVWNGSDFDTIAGQTLTITADSTDPNAPSATTAAPGQLVPGYFFATPDPTGFFDTHIDFVLNAPAADGIYLLTLRATSDQFGNSDPLYLVLSQNIDDVFVEQAVDYVNDVIIPAPGTIAPAAFVAAFCLRRRRAHPGG